VCSTKATTCQDFVQNNPSAFADAYWSVNSLKVYQDNGAANPPASSAPPSTSAPITSTQAVSALHTRARHTHPTTPVVAAIEEPSGGAVIVSAAFDDPDAKAVPTDLSTTAAASGGVFAQASSQTTPLPIISLSSTITSTVTATEDITAATLTTTSTMFNAATSTVSDAGSYITVSALNSFDFPSPGEPQTAGVPVPQKKRHVHRHMIRRLERKRPAFQ
jgi:hypothetical protein